MTRQATEKKKHPSGPGPSIFSFGLFICQVFFRNGGWCGATGRVAVVVGPKPWLRMCKSLRRPKTIFVSRGPSSRRPKQLEVGGLANLTHWTTPGNPIQPQATKIRLGLAAWADSFRGSNPNRHSCIQQSMSSSRAM